MGNTPLTFVRPSIISASMHYPLPGWIDSFAALAGPIAAFALGGLKVLHGNPAAILDVVPVDKVAECIINEALLPPVYGSVDLKNLNDTTRFVHCVSTKNNGPSTWDICFETVGYFEQPENMMLYKPHGYYIGTDDRWFYLYEFIYQYLPIKTSELMALMMLDWKGAAKARKTLERLGQVDTHFRYFVENTYDFRSAVPILGEDFDKKEYLKVVLQGVRQNLLIPLLAKEKARTNKQTTPEPKKEDVPGIVM
ncbi:hypothetical protein N0V93_005164 [Gnomoniopsis smithogilvyi]|uniref:Fatty acyl-CoA reductase n=1 Tax=Gnomoniopsis smithogilvyi TaxID=1191159 RepID=A0A9W8YTZ6_9PEZI|nr:hypothetical protein N0V93_005164 [Gnomoniopsis smithogilvyi]